MSTKRSRLKRAAPDLDVPVELEEEVDENLYLAQIHTPIVWDSSYRGFVIQDIQESQFDEVIQFIRASYLPKDLLCRNINILDDYDSVTDILSAHMNVLRDKCSICCMEEGTQRLAAILILRPIHKSDYGKVYSRIKITEGVEYNKIRKAFNYLNRKSDLFSIFECESYLRCYLLAVHDDFRNKGIGLQLLRSAVKVCRSLKIKCLMGFFDTSPLQKQAIKIGLKVINEIYYVDWIEKGEIVFCDPGPGNYTLALMAGEVHQLT